MLVLNYTACIPVILAVGIFSLFHLWAVLTNTSTIESWEKDRAHSLKRRGKIPEVSLRAFPSSGAVNSTFDQISRTDNRVLVTVHLSVPYRLCP